MNNTEIKPGHLIKDNLTGFEGIVRSVDKHLYNSPSLTVFAETDTAIDKQVSIGIAHATYLDEGIRNLIHPVEQYQSPLSNGDKVKTITGATGTVVTESWHLDNMYRYQISIPSDTPNGEPKLMWGTAEYFIKQA